MLLDKWRWLAGLWNRRYIGANKLDAIMKDWAGEWAYYVCAGF